MSFKTKVSDELGNTLRILKRKDKVTFIALDKKMGQIASCDSSAIVHFKNLTGDRIRVHSGSFVLCFRILLYLRGFGTITKPISKEFPAPA